MPYLPGSSLSADDRRHVLSAYVHRYTGDRQPAWARKPRRHADGSPDPRPYPVQFRDDADWLANTVFRVTNAGRLDRRAAHCESTPTWPHNPELRKSVAA